MEGDAYFEKVAPQWDELQRSFFSDGVRVRALSAADVRPGQRAADLGAGAGFITEGLIQAGLSVIAVDRSEAMLSVMREKHPDASALELRIGESASLPIGDGEVDCVFANMYLHHTPDPGEAIREMARILNPGGVAVITDLDEHDFEFLRKEHADVWLGFDRDEVRRLLAEAGLTDITVESVGEECCTCSESGGEQAAISIFIASGRK